MTDTMKTKIAGSYAALKDAFHYRNVMQAPRIEKVIVSTGTGKIEDKAKLALIQNRLATITGQKAAPRKARQSIARMHHVLDKLVHIALPQTRDFRGLKASAIDEMGNITLGIKEHSIFPETADEEIKDVFGLAITIVTTAKTKAEAEALLRHIGLPLQKAE
jgi:large subunit ribosomal protein L5